MTNPTSIILSPTWDIFCRVIDNYGDIGVCWRLAKQLANEHQLHIRLWVDDITPLLQLEPACKAMDVQWLSGIEVRIWKENTRYDSIGNVVIEAFACDIPSDYLALMRQAKTVGCQPIWINLEYLSAENWVDDCHKMLSIEPSSGLKKAFFFPGFSQKTGGLLKERFLLQERDAFLSDTAAISAFLETLGITYLDSKDRLIVTLFAYENVAVISLLNAWISGEKPVLCLIPEGKILISISNGLGVQLKVGDSLQKGNLLVKVIPFIPQNQYDKLLWVSDVNFIRGEDSFVRAQWAQKPFVWHIYPQDEEAHIEKLNAFLGKFSPYTDKEAFSTMEALWLGWNLGKNIEYEWNQYVKSLGLCIDAGEKWAKHLNSLGNLASNMVQFCQKPL